MPAPAFNEDLCFPQGVEDFPVQEFVPELAVEALIIALPREIDPPDRFLILGSPKVSRAR